MHLVESGNEYFSLTDRDQAYLELLKSVLAILSANHPKFEAIDLIKELDDPMTTNRAISLINDTELIFGRIMQINKEFEKGAMRERLKTKLNEDGISTKDFIAINKVLMDLDQLNKNDVEAFDPEKFKIPAPIFTSNPEALKPGARIVYDDHEDVTDEEE